MGGDHIETERKILNVPPEVKVCVFDFCKKKWNMRQCLNVVAAADLGPQYFGGLDKCSIYRWIDPAMLTKPVKD
eukprot:2496070-Amphidinium_carterae.1